MKLPKNIQKKIKIKHKHDPVFYIHSKCHDGHWKLMFNIEDNRHYLVCPICSQPAGGIDEIIIRDKYQFMLGYCSCGCGSYSLICSCIEYEEKGYWDLVCNVETNTFWLECENEQCQRIPDVELKISKKLVSELGKKKCTKCGEPLIPVL